MEAQQTRMDLIANNLANTNTAGFKKARAEFQDLLYERTRGALAPDATGGTPPSPVEVGLGVKLGGTPRNFAQGDMLNTNNPTDVAIEGQGFFQVLKPDGEVMYSRAGNFRVDAGGRLTTANGDLVEPSITFPQSTTSMDIKADGRVFAQVAGKTEPQEVGTLELAMFTNPSGLESAGGNLLRGTEGSGPAQRVRAGEEGAGELAQGFLENSNVQAVEEMIDMIVTQRAFEMNSKVIQTADQMLAKLTNLR